MSTKKCLTKVTIAHIIVTDTQTKHTKTQSVKHERGTLR